LLQFFTRAAFYGGLATAALYLFTREREEQQTLHNAAVAKVALDRQVLEARLQIMQAQIEPHFLFNTLANIGLLYEVDRKQAKPLIHSLSAYLTAALPHMREASSTLGRELAMIQAYLDIFRMRMGDRLTIRVDVPAGLHDAALPPMMLLTLVENAIKHGVNPRPRGGTVWVRAERIGDTLRVAVNDDGVGLGAGRGSGVGLANIRARLSALYGGAGRLLMEGNANGGVTAAIELPWTSTGASVSAR
jgi:LytS/YehU family sensor histidine kinase